MSGPLEASRLRELAGSRSYSRGESYFELGAVERIWREGEVAHGIVNGTQRYRVRLEPGSGDALAYTCDCPMRAVELACDPPGQVSPYEWGQGIDQALEAIAALVTGGTAQAAMAAVDLCERMVAGIVAPAGD